MGSPPRLCLKKRKRGDTKRKKKEGDLYGDSGVLREYVFLTAHDEVGKTKAKTTRSGKLNKKDVERQIDRLFQFIRTVSFRSFPLGRCDDIYLYKYICMAWGSLGTYLSEDIPWEKPRVQEIARLGRNEQIYTTESTRTSVVLRRSLYFPHSRVPRGKRGPEK